jgi:hypothetical protein
MKKLFVILSILLLGAAFGLASAQDQSKKPLDAAAQKYAALLERAKQSDATIDFRELRLAYTDTADYNPYSSDRESRKEMFAALNAKEFARAIGAAEKILTKNFVEINSHFVSYVAHRELGNADKSKFHKFMFDGLVKSILSSGDGKTADTAFVVISTDEEYTLFNVLGLVPNGQSLISQNGHSYDRLGATDRKSQEASAYFFNIDKPFNWLGQSLKK